MKNISVIIPSRRRPLMLDECLKSLIKQSIKPDEVVVVENDDHLTYSDLVEKYNNKLKIRLILEKEKGKSLARNRGIREARGEILAFLDDDCEPERNWLKKITEAILQEKVEVVLGESREKKCNLLTSAYVFQYNKFFLAERIDFVSGEVRFGDALNTRNFALKRSFIIENNIWFDHRYDKFGFVEDTDFGEQLKQAGARMRYEEEAVVVHKDEEYLWPLLKKKFKNGRAMVLMKKKGLYRDLRSKRKKKWTFERSKELIAGKNPGEIVYLILILNLIVAAYRLGFLYESVLDISLEKVKDRLLIGMPEALAPLIKESVKVPKLLFYINAHTLTLVKLFPEFKKNYYEADAYYVDGWGGVRILNKLGRNDLSKRETAPDFFDKFCDIAMEKKWKVFLLGWKKEVIKSKIKYLKKKYPELQIVGARDGYFEDSEKIVREINLRKPDILILGMGNDGWGQSKQENWAAKNREKLTVKLIWCTGALMDNYPRPNDWQIGSQTEWRRRWRSRPLKFFWRYLMDWIFLNLSEVQIWAVQKMRNW